MGLFNKSPKKLVPKVGQAFWAFHADSEKSRPFVCINTYKASGHWKVLGVYMTTQPSQFTTSVSDPNDESEYCDPRRVMEISVDRVKELGGMVNQTQFNNLLTMVKKYIRPFKHGKQIWKHQK